MTGKPTKIIDGPKGEPLEVPVDATLDEIIYASMCQFFSVEPKTLGEIRIPLIKLGSRSISLAQSRSKLA